MLEKNEEYLEDEYARPDAALTVISREQALRLFDEGKQIYLIRISPWPVLVTGREEIERGSDYFQIAIADLEQERNMAERENMLLYGSEKQFGIYQMPKKEDVVSEIIEKAVPVPDNSAQDYSDVPVYYEPFSYAKENDEVDLYRTSYRLNSECKQAIQEAIADNYDGMYLGDGAVDQVVRQYGMERVGYILANTLHHKSYDDRFSHGNKEWAEQVSTPEHNADRMTFRTDWVVDNHPAILDGFVTMYRNELEAQKRQEQPFVKQFYVVENLQAAPLKIERFGNLDDAMSQYQALPHHCMKALGVEKNPDPLPGSLDILQCRNGIDTIVEDYKTVPGWDNPYIQNHVVQPLQGALAVQDVELAQGDIIREEITAVILCPALQAQSVRHHVERCGFAGAVAAVQNGHIRQVQCFQAPARKQAKGVERIIAGHFGPRRLGKVVSLAVLAGKIKFRKIDHIALLPSGFFLKLYHTAG